MNYVSVHYVSSTIDERSGEPFEWTNTMNEAEAEAHVAKVNAGLMIDPTGKPWVGVRAEIARRRPFFCPKTLLTRCLLFARRVLGCRAVRLLWRKS